MMLETRSLPLPVLITQLEMTRMMIYGKPVFILTLVST